MEAASLFLNPAHGCPGSWQTPQPLLSGSVFGDTKLQQNQPQSTWNREKKAQVTLLPLSQHTCIALTSSKGMPHSLVPLLKGCEGREQQTPRVSAGSRTSSVPSRQLQARGSAPLYPENTTTCCNLVTYEAKPKFNPSWFSPKDGYRLILSDGRK